MELIELKREQTWLGLFQGQKRGGHAENLTFDYDDLVLARLYYEDNPAKKALSVFTTG